MILMMHVFWTVNVTYVFYILGELCKKNGVININEMISFWGVIELQVWMAQVVIPILDVSTLVVG